MNPTHRSDEPSSEAPSSLTQPRPFDAQALWDTLARPDHRMARTALRELSNEQRADVLEAALRTMGPTLKASTSTAPTRALVDVLALLLDAPTWYGPAASPSFDGLAMGLRRGWPETFWATVATVLPPPLLLNMVGRLLRGQESLPEAERLDPTPLLGQIPARTVGAMVWHVGHAALRLDAEIAFAARQAPASPADSNVRDPFHGFPPRMEAWIRSDTQDLDRLLRAWPDTAWSSLMKLDGAHLADTFPSISLDVLAQHAPNDRLVDIVGRLAMPRGFFGPIPLLQDRSTLFLAGLSSERLQALRDDLQQRREQPAPARVHPLSPHRGSWLDAVQKALDRHLNTAHPDEADELTAVAQATPRPAPTPRPR